VLYSAKDRNSWALVSLSFLAHKKPRTVLNQEVKQGEKFTFIHSNASLHCFPFLITDESIKIGSILDSILKFFGKKGEKKFMCLVLIPIPDRSDPDRSGMPWMPIPIQQNDADPTQSGPTTTLVRRPSKLNVVFD
jgi:hypothetical protein